jgi:hypothetical protein
LWSKEYQVFFRKKVKKICITLNVDNFDINNGIVPLPWKNKKKTKQILEENLAVFAAR